MTDVTSLSALLERFDTFLIDQFGVLLDGAGPYPWAPGTLASIAERGNKSIILSNSGKRAGPNIERLVAKGFHRQSFETVVSSGEAAFADLSNRIGLDLSLGTFILILSRDGDLSGIDGLDLTPTDDPAKAGLILLAGSEGDRYALSHYQDLLSAPAKACVPCLCTNPDMTMLTADGPRFGAGRIAALYEELGGPVDYIGKPYPLIYAVAAQSLGRPDPARVLCIGDSPAHDIRGGRAAGYTTALVRTGIHADTPLDTLLADLPPTDQPDFVIPRFAL